MTKEDVKEYLANGGSVEYDCWYFNASCYSCNAGCCLMDYLSLNEVVDTLEEFCNGEWGKVRLI